MRLFPNQISWLLTLFLLFLASCSSLKIISVQIPVPARIAIPNEIQSIVLMNRSMTKDFADLNQDSLEALFKRANFRLDKNFKDSLASDTLIKTLGNSMYESGRFDVVIPVRRNILNNNLSFMDTIKLLSLPQAKQISSEFNVNAMLLLEHIDEKVNISSQVETYPYGGDSGDYYNIFNSVVSVYSHSVWNLYQPLEKLEITKFEIKDTLFWERKGGTLKKSVEKLPMIKEVLITGAIENARKFAGMISPGWQTEERFYYLTCNKEADEAVSQLKKNDWNQAEAVWMKFSGATAPEFRSRIEANLALAAEMNGDPKEALEWIRKSLLSKSHKETNIYYNRLLHQPWGDLKY